MIRALHLDIKARVIFVVGSLQRAWKMKKARRPWCKSSLCNTLWSCDATYEVGIYIITIVDQGMFLIRSDGNSKRNTSLIKELLYAGDCDIINFSEMGIWSLVSAFQTACDDFGLTNSLKENKSWQWKYKIIVQNERNLDIKAEQTFGRLVSCV